MYQYIDLWHEIIQEIYAHGVSFNSASHWLFSRPTAVCTFTYGAALNINNIKFNFDRYNYIT